MSKATVEFYGPEHARRALVTMPDGCRWWIAPDGLGAYAVRADDGNPHYGDALGVGTFEEGLREVLGDEADRFLAEVER